MHIYGAKFQIVQGLESLASGISTRLLNGPVTSSDSALRNGQRLGEEA